MFLIFLMVASDSMKRQQKITGKRYRIERETVGGKLRLMNTSHCHTGVGGVAMATGS